MNTLFVFWLLTWPLINTDSAIPAKYEDLLRVSTYNILFQNNNPERVSSLVLRNKSDLILILEYNGHNFAADSLYQAGYKLYVDYPRFHPGGIAFLAHESVNVKSKLLPSPVRGTCSMPLVIARVTHRSQTYAVIGIHAPPPFSRCQNQTYSLLSEIAAWIYKGRLVQDIEPARKGDLVILLGDFNTASFNPILDIFESCGLKDAYTENHSLPAGTWSPALWLMPLLRIDFIYISKNMVSANSWHVEIPGSDHYGVIADIVPEKKE